jgi:uncharacterized protein YgbK (DUF1537 family)
MITVIADDITGAAEIAGVCLRYGLNVSFGIYSVPDVEADVCVIATDSRSATETEAYGIYHDLMKVVLRGSDSVVFKKCDSALRGFVLTELSAMLEAMKLKRVILQPSNPSLGRCIRKGIYYIDNVKIENTAFAHDPDFPATGSEIQQLLLKRSPTRNQITDIHTDNIHTITGEGLFIPDCSTVEDLTSSSELSGNESLLCGSAAFFEQVLFQKRIVTMLKDQPETSISSDFLLISGSTHSTSRDLANQMLNRKCPVIAFPPALLQQKVGNTVINDWANELRAVWSKKNKLTLTISENNISFPNSSSVLKQRMSIVVRSLVEHCDIKELLIEGGATAYSILNLLNCKTLIPVQELSPGVIRMENSLFPSMHLTIKPGSYSWPENFLSDTD